MNREVLTPCVRALHRTQEAMDRERYKLPAHQRAKYFGGYREELAEAQVLAVIKAYNTAVSRIKL